ncbi:MAG: hypothetical protein JXX29_21885 [Deltaproteobacteria bacterium]|nr:hypothetical protein [Deltaproteobacteria bacterium]MBN2674346.1 hypothetical protein [Deltaproteobacteria bacterium]
MSSIDLHNDEIGIKIVYYGPGLGGKTSSLQYMHSVLKPENRGRMISLATGIDRTLYFDFLPIQLPKIKNFSIRMSVYTVPGQVHYDATRKLVLQGADGVVFVADSQPARQDANIESMDNLRENLKNHGMDPNTVPMIIQYNKRDLQNVMTVEQMDNELNFRDVPFFETSATKGTGVYDALKAITKLVLADLKKKGIYRDESTSIVPKPILENTSPQVTIEGATQPPPPANDSGAFEFPTSDVVTRRNNESSESLVAAIAHHTQLRQSSPPPPANLEDFIRFSNLWTLGHIQVSEIETVIKNEEYTNAVAMIEELLEQHLKLSGGTHRSVEEGLLSLGVCSAHYLRFNAITAKPQSGGDVTLTDALFCLFFITDVELRMQAAGLKA